MNENSSTAVIYRYIVSLCNNSLFHLTMYQSASGQIFEDFFQVWRKGGNEMAKLDFHLCPAQESTATNIYLHANCERMSDSAPSYITGTLARLN